MRHQLSLSLSALALAFVLSLAGPALSQTAATGVSVYDGKHVFVGTILDMNKIWVKLADGDALLEVDPAGEFIPAAAVFYYKTFDCTGPAYMDAADTPAKGAFVELPRKPNFVSRGFIRYPKPPFEQFDAIASSSSASKTCMPIPAKPVIAGKAGSIRLEGYQSPLAIQ